MWDMAQQVENEKVIWKICGNGLKYMSNDLDMWEMPKMCGKWLRSVGNGLSIWEMNQICGNSLRYVGSSLNMLKPA